MAVIHGTCGATMTNCVGYDILGQAVFLEEGTERRNTITFNVVTKVRQPSLANMLQKHDRQDQSDVGPCGFMVTNPDNTFTDNEAFDCEGYGIWHSFSDIIPGQTAAVATKQNYTRLGTFARNVGACNKRRGALTEFAVADDNGAVKVMGFEPHADDGQWGAITTATFTAYKTWKNSEGGYLNRAAQDRTTRAG